MRQVATALIAMTCLVFFGAVPARAQVAKTVSVNFVNCLDMNVVVQGTTYLNKVARSGMRLQIDKNNGKAFETNVPAGNIRYYSVYDAKTFKLLLRDHPVPVQNQNLQLEIIPSPTNPGRITIAPAKGQ